MSVKAIIWDMGGVILYMKDETFRKELAHEFNLPLERIYREIFDSISAQQAMTGRINVLDHWASVSRELAIPAERLREFLEKFWSTDAIDEHLIALIHLLGRQYKIGLLSNAWDNMRYLMTDDWKIADAFDDLVISAEVGLAKPDPEIYRLAASRLGVQPAEVLFIDDLGRNIQAAQAVGFQTVRFITRRQCLVDLLSALQTGGQNLSPDLQDAIERLKERPNDRLINSYDLIRLQVELEYQLDAQEQITPFPGAVETARMILYRSSSGVWPFFQANLPFDFRERVHQVGLDLAFTATGEFQDRLLNMRVFKQSSPFHCYIFSRLPQQDEFSQVCVQDGRFEIIIDGKPVCWAWSVCENRYCAEVAVETLPGYRRKGYARQVVAAWGRAVLGQGRVAFFSHRIENLPSRALAMSLGMEKFAESISFD